MELMILSFAMLGAATAICAIDDFLDWLPSYKREGGADLEWQKRQIKENYERYYRE